jgi:hypothetical protein
MEGGCQVGGVRGTCGPETSAEEVGAGVGKAAAYPAAAAATRRARRRIEAWVRLVWRRGERRRPRSAGKMCESEALCYVSRLIKIVDGGRGPACEKRVVRVERDGEEGECKVSERRCESVVEVLARHSRRSR